MSFPRASGILLHPTSLPGRHGIGDLGREAYEFVDFLEAAGQSLWQVLPLGPTGYGDSPYQCFSAFAGNPLLINPDALVESGLLSAEDLAASPQFPVEQVDYGPVIEFKTKLLSNAHANFVERGSEEAKAEYLKFTQQMAWWLDDYATYRAIKDEHDGKEWTTWEPYLRDRENQAMHFFRENHALEISRHKFWQYLFFKQWLALAAYANGKGVRIIGDVPIFVAHDSADVWANPQLFHLDEQGAPTLMAGVPPDYFSETGQLWGNPLYRWELMAEDGYQWWLKRIRATLSLVDVVRLDHFRGFEKYWAVPAGEDTAVNGEWLPGPGADFFNAIKAAFADAENPMPIIAENLGMITPEVEKLREDFNLPGMSILQFAFGTDPQADEFKPYSFTPNTVVYTGTHDNDTTVGWFTSEGAGESTRSNDEVNEEREFVLKYLGTDGKEIHWDFIRLALASVADTAIIPLQDVLGLGSEARMNTPARESGNWGWRYKPEQLTPAIRDRLAELTEIYGRNRARLKHAVEEPADVEETT
ncbi:MAG TPA: 4-alpha-glucanotransferase [Blastocatellia bacterium]|nr:4-alpha-glucanotransferase [Blastocatellia bacterium]HMZ18028.1 4-alpha-glucanotransferase [Blastocatellia bacterium]HNG31151.1 4-alpha-glucanotransferase [Blastocatellia bacterium]